MFFLIKDFSSEYHTETAIKLSRKKHHKKKHRSQDICCQKMKIVIFPKYFIILTFMDVTNENDFSTE